MLIKQQLTKLSIILLFMQPLFISGCATDKYKEGLNISEEYSVTDREILEFNNHVRHMLRLKMKYSTIAAYTASTVAIGTATAATILSAGGAAGAITVASLAGASAFSTDIMGIFSFSDSTMAYQDGVALMERAEAKYFREIASKSTSGVIAMNTLSIEAANLYTETIGALTLVEKALASRIPTMAEVRQATGNTIANTKSIIEGNSGALSSIFVEPSNKFNLIQIKEGEKNYPTKTIAFKGDVPAISVVSLDKTILTVSETDSRISAEIKGIHAGNATVVVVSSNGTPTRIDVEVSSPISIKSANVEITGDIFKAEPPVSKTYKMASVSKIKKATMSPSGSGTCGVTPTFNDLIGQNNGEFSVKNCKEGTYTFTFENEFGTAKVLTLKVVN